MPIMKLGRCVKLIHCGAQYRVDPTCTRYCVLVQIHTGMALGQPKGSCQWNLLVTLRVDFDTGTSQKRTWF